MCNFLSRSTVVVATALAVLAPSSLVLAQAADVDAGVLARQTKTDLALQPNQDLSRPQQFLSLPPITASGVPPGGPRISVKAWVFEGNSIFADTALREVLAPFTNRALTFAQISDAAAAVEAYYDAQGYLVRTLIPAQEVTGGAIRLQVIEAQFAGLRYSTTSDRVKPEQITRIFDRKTQNGAPVQPDAFDTPLLLANDLAGVSVTGAFAPGKKPGETVLVLTTRDADPFSFQLSTDNHGARATGSYRLNVQGRALSPLRMGDDLTVGFSRSEGNLNGSLQYTLPISGNGLKASFDLRALRYGVITDEFAALDAKGTSQTARIGLSYPLRRSRDVNINLTAHHERAWFDNQASGATVSDYQMQQTGIGVSGYWFDDLWGVGASRWSASLVNGTVTGDRGGAFDDSFTVARLSFSRLQTVNDKLSLYTSISAQHGPKGLDSSEEFSLGGPSAVRAYPRGEAAGPSGAMLSLEARWLLANEWQLSTFYDHGYVAGRSDTGEPSSYNLKGMGLSLNWSGANGLSADLSLARRIGRNPNAITDSGRPASVQGFDQDGSLDQNRIWFSITKRF